MLKKSLISFIVLTLALQQAFPCNNPQPTPVPQQPAQPQLPASFTPTFYITQQQPQDVTLLEEIRPLFFEADQTANPKREVYTKAIKQYGAQELTLLTDDDMRISAIYFKRPHAKINLIYIPGYFFDLTPTKEWACPFALLFKEFNVLSIDWRGIGTSEGVNKLLHKNSFGKYATPDIQAAIDFMAKENNNPNVLIGFCFGAAMNMYATVQAQKESRRTADALVCNCVFTKFENQFNRAVLAEDRLLQRLILQSGLGRRLIEYQTHGSLFDVNPIDLIKEVKIPCYFEHFTFDPFAIIQEGVEVYQAATCPKMFMRSDIGRHVRMHTKVPYQYRQAFLTFLQSTGLLTAQDYETLLTPVTQHTA